MRRERAEDVLRNIKQHHELQSSDPSPCDEISIRQRMKIQSALPWEPTQYNYNLGLHVILGHGA